MVEWSDNPGYSIQQQKKASDKMAQAVYFIDETGGSTIQLIYLSDNTSLLKWQLSLHC